MTLALIAGTGDLPPAIVATLPDRPLICALRGFTPQITPDVTFAIEQLGPFLKDLRRRGVTQICMAGAIRRPPVRISAISPTTWPLVPTILRALRRGDDGALRGFMAILEGRGFSVVGAHEIAPHLLPPAGVLTQCHPTNLHHADTLLADAELTRMGQADLGQACVVRAGHVIATEDDAGTDAMIGALPYPPGGGTLFKGPKPNQDRRADLPTIGLNTARMAVQAGLDGIVLDYYGVMVLDRASVVGLLDAHGMFLWIRPTGAA